MFVFPEMLVEPALQAGIKVPNDLDHYDRSQYPHWVVFCALQLGSPMPHAAVHWDNAKVIAAIPEDRISKVTAQDVLDLGFRVGHSTP